MIAFSEPGQGEIPFTAVYELFPSGMLEIFLKKYGMVEEIGRTNRGTLLVSFDDRVNVDAGNEINVDIPRVKLDTSTPSGTLVPAVMVAIIFIGIVLVLLILSFISTKVFRICNF